MTTKVPGEMLDSTSKSLVSTSLANVGKVPQLDANGLLPVALIKDTLTFTEVGLLQKSANPSDPADGNAAVWMSDGTDSGNEGDVMVKITTSLPASYADAADYSGFTINDSFTITVSGVAYTVLTEGVDATGSVSTTATTIAIGCSSGPSAGTVAETVVDAINGFFGSGGTYNHAFASANTGVNSGVPGVTATLSGSTKITLNSDVNGIAGNSTAVANVVGNAATNGSFSGGAAAVTKTATLIDYSAV